MALFKLAIGYAGSSMEDTIEVKATSRDEARQKCEAIIKEGREKSERLARMNIYVSRTVESCRICRGDLRTEMSAVEEMFNSLKNDV